MTPRARRERLLALRLWDFREVAQHAQRELIEHREQGGELLRDRFLALCSRGASGFDDALFRRCQLGVGEGEPTAAIGLKEPFLDVTRERDAAFVGLVTEPNEFLFAQVGCHLSSHSSLSFASFSVAASAEPLPLSTANLRNESCSAAGAALGIAFFGLAAGVGVTVS